MSGSCSRRDGYREPSLLPSPVSRSRCRTPRFCQCWRAGLCVNIKIFSRTTKNWKQPTENISRPSNKPVKEFYQRNDEHRMPVILARVLLWFWRLSKIWNVRSPNWNLNRSLKNVKKKEPEPNPNWNHNCNSQKLGPKPCWSLLRDIRRFSHKFPPRLQAC
jgi:hypothetical protein